MYSILYTRTYKHVPHSFPYFCFGYALYIQIADVSSSVCPQPRKWPACCQYGWQQVWGRAHLRQRKGVMKSMCYTYHDTAAHMHWCHTDDAAAVTIHLCVSNIIDMLSHTGFPPRALTLSTRLGKRLERERVDWREGGGAEKTNSIIPDLCIAPCLNPLFEPHVCIDIQHRFGIPCSNFGPG